MTHRVNPHVPRLLSIDPGIRGCGAALFVDSELAKAGYVKNSVLKGDDPAAILGMALELMTWATGSPFGGVGELVIEWPQIYQSRRIGPNPNDLLPLAGIGCALAAYLELHGATTRYLPRTWRGNKPKEEVGEKILGRLSEDEKATVKNAGARHHNVIDAIGLGLYHIGRFSPRVGVAA